MRPAAAAKIRPCRRWSWHSCGLAPGKTVFHRLVLVMVVVMVLVVVVVMVVLRYQIQIPRFARE